MKENAQSPTTEEAVRAAVTQLREQFPESAVLLFSMGLRAGTMDYEELHREGVLEGGDDKKIDFFDIDYDSGVVTVAQAYESDDWDKEAPPANKASDLNTALAWLISAELTKIPRLDIRARAEELRDAIQEGHVSAIEAMFIHNLKPSKNVQNELSAVEANLRSILAGVQADGNDVIHASAREVSLTEIVQWQEAQHSAILIADTITLETKTPPQETSGVDWRSYFATISAAQLVPLVSQYGDALFSANLRDYLGGRDTRRNINQQIEKSATQEPGNFWVYNNGITALTRQIVVDGNTVTCTGLAVINGAQTLGSLAEVAESTDLETVDLLVRFVQSASGPLVRDIIRYNNTQNPIKPWELRVGDPIQERIESELKDSFGLTYRHRRGTERWTAQDIQIDKLARWLSAFYSDPGTAHRNSPELYSNETKYRTIFSTNSDVRHLLFVYRLGQAVGKVKDELRTIAKREDAPESAETLYGYFRYGAFSYVVMDLCAETLCNILSTRERNRITAPDELLKDEPKALDALTPFVKAVLRPLPAYLREKDAYVEFKTKAGIDGLKDSVTVSLQQLEDMNPEVWQPLRKVLAIAPS